MLPWKKNAENRIENTGSWPIRSTDFFLVDDYEFPPSPYTEIFLVRAGNFFHETDLGTQAVREGAVIVHLPSARHTIRKPEEVQLTRIRFLPEWFASDHEILLEAPDVISLCFVSHWFEIPLDTRIQVFTTQATRLPILSTLFDLLNEVLRAGRHADPVARVTLLEILMVLGEDYHVYWRGGNRLLIPDEVIGALLIVERSIAAGGPTPMKQLQESTGMKQEELTGLLKKSIGMTLPDYVQRRRLHHAAHCLLRSDQDPEKVASLFGFKDQSALDGDFEAEFNFAPQIYREKFSGKAPTAVAVDSSGEPAG